MAQKPLALQEQQKREEEERERREEARRIQEEQAEREAERHEISVSPEVEDLIPEPDRATPERIAELEEQRGYDPRFDDPDYGVDERDDEPDPWRQPTAPDDPYAATYVSSGQPAISSTPAPQLPTFDWTPNEILEKEARDNQNLDGWTPQSVAQSVRDFVTGANRGEEEQQQPQVERPLINPAVMAEFQADQGQQWTTEQTVRPERNPWEAYQEAQRMDQLLGQRDLTAYEQVTGESLDGTPVDIDDRDFLTRTAFAPINAGPKLGAAATNVAQWIGYGAGEILPGQTEEVIVDAAASGFDSLMLPADLTETLPIWRGYTVGELASAAGESLVTGITADATVIPEAFGGTGLSPDGTVMTPEELEAFEQGNKTFAENFSDNMAEREATRQDYQDLTEDERVAYDYAVTNAYSGPEAVEKTYNDIISQEEQIAALRAEQQRAIEAGDPTSAALAGAAADELASKTPRDFVDDNYQIGPEFVGSGLLDPLILIDGLVALTKLGPVSRRVGKAVSTIMDATDAQIMDNMVDLEKALAQGPQPGGGARGKYDAWGAFFGNTDESRAMMDRDRAFTVTTQMFRGVEDKRVARELAQTMVDNPKAFPEALRQANIGTYDLANSETIDALARVLPGMRDQIAEFTSLQGGGQFNAADFGREFWRAAEQVANDYYGVAKDKPSFMGYKKATDFMRGLMSTQYLNYTPRQIFRNATSFMGHVFMDGQMNIKPMDNVVENIQLKYGDLMATPRVSESFGALEGVENAGGAASQYGASSRFDNVMKQIPGVSNIFFDAKGEARWQGSGFLGEQRMYTRAWDQRMMNTLKDLWPEVVRGNLEGPLYNAGLDQQTVEQVINLVADVGVNRNHAEAVTEVRKAVVGDGNLFSLTGAGIDADSLTPQNYAALRSTLDNYSNGVTSADDAAIQIREVFDAERQRWRAAIAEGANAGPSRKTYSTVDDAADVTEVASNVAAAGGHTPEAKAAAQALVDQGKQELDRFYNTFVDAFRTEGTMTPETFGVFIDTWRDVQALRNTARNLQYKAFTTWQKAGDRATAWPKYLQDTRAAYETQWAKQQELVQDMTLAVQDSIAGRYTRRWDNTLDELERVTQNTPSELVETMTTGTREEAIAAQRMLVDQSSVEAYVTAQRYGNDINAIDIIMSAETDVQNAALRAAATVDDLRNEAYATKNWATYDADAGSVWKQFALETKDRYQAASNDIVRTFAGAGAVDEVAEVAETAALAPMDELRRVAGQAGIATDRGPNYLYNAINKDLGTNYTVGQELTPDQIADATRAMQKRADRAALPDDMDDILAATGSGNLDSYYTADGSANIEDVYNANNGMRSASNNPTPPNIGAAAEHMNEYLNQAMMQVLGSLDSIPVSTQGMQRQQAAAIVDAVRRLKPQWDNVTAAARDAATAGADFSGLNYNNRRGFDTLLAAVVPFHYWQTRTAKNWLERIAAHPGFLNDVMATEDISDRIQEREDIPQRYDGMFPVPGTDNQLWVANMLNYFFPVNDIYARNGFANPEQSNSVAGRSLETIGTFNFSTWPALDNMVMVAEGRGNEVNWGNMAYPYRVINDLQKAVTGRELSETLQDPYGTYTEARAGDELVVRGDISTDAIGYAEQMLVNEEMGRDVYHLVPEHMQEEATAARDQMRQRQGWQNAVRSVSSFMGPAMAYYAPEEAQAREAQREYGEAGYSYDNQGGSQAARDNVVEKYPFLPAWWSRADLMPGNIENANPAIQAQTGQYWDEYIRISEAETAAVGQYILDNAGDVSSEEIRNIREPFQAQKEAAKAKYPAVEEFESRRDRTTNAMNPFEEATQVVEDIMRYQPPNKPEWPGDGASKEQVRQYYADLGKWEDKRIDHKEDVLEQMALDSTGAADNAEGIVYQIVTGNYAADMMRAFDNRYASGPEIFYEEQKDLQQEMNSDEWQRRTAARDAEVMARRQTVENEFGPEVAALWDQYYALPAGDERRAFKQANDVLYEASDAVYNPERRQQAQELFGPNIYDDVRNYPGKKADDPEAWQAWRDSITPEQADNVFGFFAWSREQRAENPISFESYDPLAQAPNWMDVEGTQPRPIGSGRLPVNLAEGQDRAFYEEQGLMVNPYIGTQERVPPGGEFGNVAGTPMPSPVSDPTAPGYVSSGRPATGRPPTPDGVNPYTASPDYNPLPGWNALPVGTTPSTLPALTESIEGGELTPEIMQQIQDGVYQSSLGAGGAGLAPAPAAAAAPGGGGGGWGGGGWGGGRSSFTPQSRPVDVRNLLIELIQYRLANWRPYVDSNAIERAIREVRPR